MEPGFANSRSQNLIPLVLRPLRLVLSAERLRAVRILILKATHFPHVLAISMYEHMRRYLADRDLKEPLTERSKSHRPHLRSNRLSTPQPLAAAILKPTVLLNDARSSNSSPQRRSQAPTSLEEIKTTLSQLTAQIEQLTKRIEDHDYDQDRH